MHEVLYEVRTNSKAENKQTKDIGRESSHALGFLLNLANEREVRQGAVQ